MIRLNSLSYTLMLAVAGSLALAGCKKQQEEAPADTMPPPAATAPAETAPAAPAPAAVTVDAVTVGTSAAADKSVAPVASIAPSDQIVVSVKTDGTASNTTIGAKLTFRDGQTAGEQSQALDATGPATTNITFANTKPWPAGKYTAQAVVDGRPAGQPQEFEVK